MRRFASQKEIEEQEATLFAMELLMPAQFLERDLKDEPPFDICNDDRITALAKRYQVSEVLMINRLHQLGYLGQ